MRLPVARLAAVALLLLPAPLAAESQEAKIYRVGVLGPPGKVEEEPQIKGFRDGLKEAGYVEGKNLQLNIPNVDTYDELRRIAKAYVEARIDAIVTSGGTATGIAREATKEVPIIFVWGVGDPVALGFVKSFARPQTNITGLTSEAGTEIYSKRLQLFKDAVPSLRRIVLLYNARGENPDHAKRLALTREIAPKLGLTLNEKPAKSIADVDDVLRAVSKETSDGIFILCSGLFSKPWKKITLIAIQKTLPVSGCFPERSVEALFYYSPDRYRTGHRGAWYVDRILKGAKPRDLPIEQPTKYELVINLRTAKALGLTIPPLLLQQADRVIE